MGTADSNSESNVVEIRAWKNQKRAQKQQYLFVEEHYKHLAMPICIKILALSTKNPFTDNYMYLCVDQKGSVLCFDEGEEGLWQSITVDDFKVEVEREVQAAMGTNLAKELNDKETDKES